MLQGFSCIRVEKLVGKGLGDCQAALLGGNRRLEETLETLSLGEAQIVNTVAMVREEPAFGPLPANVIGPLEESTDGAGDDPACRAVKGLFGSMDCGQSFESNPLGRVARP